MVGFLSKDKIHETVLTKIADVMHGGTGANVIQ